MNNTLKWAKLESIMIAVFQIKGISASKNNRYMRDHISFFQCSY